MRSISAKDAKHGFGRLIDMALAAPVTIAKHGRPVVVVLSVEEFDRMQSTSKLTPVTKASPPRSKDR